MKIINKLRIESKTYINMYLRIKKKIFDFIFFIKN
jgi:hypothetical protein